MEKFYTIESFKKIPNYLESVIVFGGTFDPIHQGHIADINKLLEISNSVYLAPTHQNPWKLDNPTPLAMRIEMICLALAAEDINFHLASNEKEFDSSIFKTSQVKILTTPYTYSIDVLKLLQSQNISNIFWAIGEDLVESAPKWLGWQEDGVPFIVLPLIDGYSATFVRENSIEPIKAIKQYVEAHSLYSK